MVKKKKRTRIPRKAPKLSTEQVEEHFSGSEKEDEEIEIESNLVIDTKKSTQEKLEKKSRKRTNSKSKTDNPFIPPTPKPARKKITRKGIYKGEPLSFNIHFFL